MGESNACRRGCRPAHCGPLRRAADVRNLPTIGGLPLCGLTPVSSRFPPSATASRSSAIRRGRPPPESRRVRESSFHLGPGPWRGRACSRGAAVRFDPTPWSRGRARRRAVVGEAALAGAGRTPRSRRLCGAVQRCPGRDPRRHSRACDPDRQDAACPSDRGRRRRAGRVGRLDPPVHHGHGLAAARADSGSIARGALATRPARPLLGQLARRRPHVSLSGPCRAMAHRPGAMRPGSSCVVPESWRSVHRLARFLRTLSCRVQTCDRERPVLTSARRRSPPPARAPASSRPHPAHAADCAASSNAPKTRRPTGSCPRRPSPGPRRLSSARACSCSAFRAASEVAAAFSSAWPTHGLRRRLVEGCSHTLASLLDGRCLRQVAIFSRPRSGNGRAAVVSWYLLCRLSPHEFCRLCVSRLRRAGSAAPTRCCAALRHCGGAAPSGPRPGGGARVISAAVGACRGTARVGRARHDAGLASTRAGCGWAGRARRGRRRIAAGQSPTRRRGPRRPWPSRPACRGSPLLSRGPGSVQRGHVPSRRRRESGPAIE